MNDVRLHVPYIFGNKQNSKKTEDRERQRRIRGRTEGTTESREAWYQERPAVGQDKLERGKANAR